MGGEGAVAAAHELAARAGADVLAGGGNAVDAALAAGAVMAVVAPDMCGIGGDMFALVKRPNRPPDALNGSGRAGSGADPERLRSSGVTDMPFRHQISSVTVPGCVAGWCALHERFASWPLEEVLARARDIARDGFPVPPPLAKASLALERSVRQSAFGTSQPLRPGMNLALPRIAATLDEVARHGAAGFYRGPAGAELLDLGRGEFTDDDLIEARADWTEPLTLRAFGHELWTVPPNSQAYLVLASAWIAQQLQLPGDPNDEEWAFALIEATRQAAFDRVEVLHEHADGAALIAAQRLEPRVRAVHAAAARGLADVYGDGGTTHVCAVDGERVGVSLIMSNAAGFGSHLTLPASGVFLHNRGIGFSLRPGHASEYGPRRRPPHTLSPLVVTSARGTLEAVLGTMGADAQPQILLQLLVRMFVLGASPVEAVSAPRWILSRPGSTGFDVWGRSPAPLVRLERGAPARWMRGLRARGYTVQEAAAGDRRFGHAQVIRAGADGRLVGAADPRAGTGAVAGL